jgi:hypothetical protein
MQTPEKPFNDFFLLGLSHLVREELFNPNGSIKEGAKAEIEKRLEYGKAAIRQRTRPGDLIAFEGREHWKFEDFCKLNKSADLKKNKERIRRDWNSILRANLNFYADLADYAESIGRRVVSLEPSVRKPGSNLRQAEWRRPKDIVKWARMYYLLGSRADISFLRRIQRNQPKMSVVAAGHAIYLENVMKPKGVDYLPKITQELKEMGLKEKIQMRVEYDNLKRSLMKRRQMEKLKEQHPRSRAPRKPKI